MFRHIPEHVDSIQFHLIVCENQMNRNEFNFQERVRALNSCVNVNTRKNWVSPQAKKYINNRNLHFRYRAMFLIKKPLHEEIIEFFPRLMDYISNTERCFLKTKQSNLQAQRDCSLKVDVCSVWPTRCNWMFITIYPRWEPFQFFWVLAFQFGVNICLIFLWNYNAGNYIWSLDACNFSILLHSIHFR